MTNTRNAPQRNTYSGDVTETRRQIVTLQKFNCVFQKTPGDLGVRFGMTLVTEIGSETPSLLLQGRSPNRITEYVFWFRVLRRLLAGLYLCLELRFNFGLCSGPQRRPIIIIAESANCCSLAATLRALHLESSNSN